MKGVYFKFDIDSSGYGAFCSCHFKFFAVFTHGSLFCTGKIIKFLYLCLHNIHRIVTFGFMDMKKIKEGQIWRIRRADGRDGFLKCFRVYEDRYDFMPVSRTVFSIQDYHSGEIEKVDHWRVCSGGNIIRVSWDGLDFFFSTAVLEQDVKVD